MTDTSARPAPDEDPSRAAPPLPSYQARPVPAPDPVADPALQALARKRLAALHAWRRHVGVYAAVMGLLVAIWLLTDPFGYFWPVWPMLGWGLGLVLHRLSIDGDRPPSQEEVDAEARRLARGRGPRALEDQ